MDYFHEDIEDVSVDSFSVTNNDYINTLIKKDSSWWYSTYNDLVRYNDQYDIEKKKFKFPEMFFISDKEGPNFEEMKKRYLFLAENSLFLLAPLVRERQDDTYLLLNDIYLMVLIEKMLFGDEILEDTEFYKKVMEYKEDSKYLDAVKKGLTILNNKHLTSDITNVDIAMFNILKRVRGYIEGQEKCFNKTRKLTILDEYFKIVRYSNDGCVWTSGYELTKDDINNNLKGSRLDPFTDNQIDVTPVLNRGVGLSKFINGFNVKKYRGAKSYICFSLTEKDKQDIYLKLHDELPWDLEIKCEKEEPELTSMIDSRLIRPDDTNPCDFSFRIKEGEIFVHGRSFYHLCSNCGFIVKVDNSLLSEGIKGRIRERCSKDKNLFRKMELISELQALDDKSLPQHKILFKSLKEAKAKCNYSYGTTTVRR